MTTGGTRIAQWLRLPEHREGGSGRPLYFQTTTA